jgi:hypothetical protein
MTARMVPAAELVGQCRSCAEFDADPTTHGQHPACVACGTRALAAGIEFFFSKRDGKMTRPYRRALASLYGSSREQIEAGHAAVLVYAERIAAGRRARV